MAKKRKEPQFEYRLTLARHFNEQRQVRTTLATLETSKLFASFRYELSVREEIRAKEIHLKVLGLSAPSLSLPAVGTARYIGEYDSLKGKHDFIVERLDGTKDIFTINFSTELPTLLKSPKNPFTKLRIT